ncbi:uncharacterized protein EV422DRAFT_525557 [Fimicolochytrium jonesii]|uniref:uncharacterized protein n=1 Tax=Fimicolochytrium jonesii TaxID=1396493 RepID=UPI0022FE6186|nr:uncharacterized protein EV422DRAFT_525557 [Fimicolochytrium jonesii]KAI8822069.1 hypothetical protein EV422DRAFT_525557 [Fimicolochytrium jonesii]
MYSTVHTVAMPHGRLILALALTAVACVRRWTLTRMNALQNSLGVAGVREPTACLHVHILRTSTVHIIHAPETRRSGGGWRPNISGLMRETDDIPTH